MKHYIDFTDQVCVITGAGSAGGIGFACGKIFAELGAKVALIATGERIHERAKELCEQGGTAKGYIADLMEREQVRRVVEEIVADFGKIDILVNNAGLSQGGTKDKAPDFMEMPFEQWDKVISRNLGITMNMIKNVLPGMVEKGYGRIVNVSSVTGPVVSASGDSAYGAAKAAVNGMSKAIAIETGTKGITINNVMPGWIKTDVQSKRGAMGGENTPLGRSVLPEEVAAMVVFLASDKASGITGQDFAVDGGNVIQEFKGSDKELAALL